MMKIYTKKGDRGRTSLFVGGCVPKCNKRVKAYGTVDELNSYLGVCSAICKDEEILKLIGRVQSDLFVVGSNLAISKGRESSSLKVKNIEQADISFLEKQIDLMADKLPKLTNFILPGGDLLAAKLHYARAVCRKAERDVASLNEEEDVAENIQSYLNRLSDFLFMLARLVNMHAGRTEQIWSA